MLLYFEFEEQRHRADVTWQKKGENIVVHLTDIALTRKFPTDLYFKVTEGNKVEFDIEDKDNTRLLDLQNVLRRRLQEFVTKN